MQNSKGMLFDIQHFSLQDGPGVRTTVFFKGCPLRCKWCSNPESQIGHPQMMHYSQLCARCGLCQEVCPQGAILFDQDGTFYRTSSCTVCGECAKACPNGASVMTGYGASVEDVCKAVDEDWRIITRSGGGMTVSGGEPFAQAQFLHDILQAIHEEFGFQTCIETSAFTPWENIERVLPYLDMLYVDVKHMIPLSHKAGTGVDNEIILENIAKLAQRKAPVTLRIPLIPQYNDTDVNIRALGSFMQEQGLSQIEIMPQHLLGKSKYLALNRVYDINEIDRPNVSYAVELLEQFGCKVFVHRK